MSEKKQYYDVYEHNGVLVRVKNEPNFDLIARALKDLYDEVNILEGIEDRE